MACQVAADWPPIGNCQLFQQSVTVTHPPGRADSPRPGKRWRAGFAECSPSRLHRIPRPPAVCEEPDANVGGSSAHSTGGRGVWLTAAESTGGVEDLYPNASADHPVHGGSPHDSVLLRQQGKQRFPPHRASPESPILDLTLGTRGAAHEYATGHGGHAESG